ncbi:glycosyltransferase family 4 protein [Halorientalis marina]|uniref:glycosyltransferase family 4 protein n=1 Tax=Halorientalis marina TaxID=2931976 RepID=UPI001FF426E5|nr:glycosyltransferase family 4 protein [Halorientalis marina]
MVRIALIRGPYLRPDGVRPWEYLHNETDYEVVAFASDPPRFDISSLSMPVEQLPWPEGRFDLFGYDHFFSRAIRKLRFPSDYLVGLSSLTERFDVLHTSENFNLFSLQAARATVGTDTLFAYSAGENIPYPIYQHNPLLWRVKTHVNRRASGITTTTPVGKRALIHEGVSHEKLTILPNAVDLDLFRPTQDVGPSDLDLPEELTGTTNILFVHRLCEQKGTYELLDAFREVAPGHDDVRLILLGDDELDDAESTYVHQSEQILWRERIPYASMPALYSLADITVLPSVTMPNNEEQFGMAILEAMACETATVVTNVGGLPYVVAENETSLVVPERDPEALAEALSELVSDPDRRARLGRNGKQRAAELFSPATVGQRLESFYDDLFDD